MPAVNLTYGDVARWRNSTGGNWSQQELEQVLTVFRLEPPLLDLGCGNGRWRNCFPSDTVSFDLASHAAKPFIRGVAQHLPFKEESFRTVVAVTVIQHVPFEEKPLVYQEVLRVLTPDGSFLMVEGNGAVSNNYIWSLPAGELAESVKPYFHVAAVAEPDGQYCALLLRKP